MFTAGQIAIWLHVPTANDNKATFLDTYFKFFKHIRVKILNPLIHRCRRANEFKIRKLFKNSGIVDIEDVNTSNSVDINTMKTEDLLKLYTNLTKMKIYPYIAPYLGF